MGVLWLGWRSRGLARVLVLGLALELGASSQAQTLAAGGARGENDLYGYRHAGVWSEPLGAGAFPDSGLRAGRVPVQAWLGAAQLGGTRFGLDEGAEELAARLGVTPPPVSRAALEGSSEALLEYHGVPGGIVLGLEACASGELARVARGARIEGTAACGLVLRLADGSRLRWPAIAPATLEACLAFLGSARDALVDLSGPETPERLAPAFARSPLAEELVRLDRLPHRLHPETRAWKTLIVDRAVRVEARGDALVLSADLEVRLYARDRAHGQATRAGTMAAAAADFVGPRTPTDCGTELAPLAELAAWLGFLRWAERVDPQGFARLRTEG